MPDPLTSLVLVLALATGLGAAIVVAQQAQDDRSDFQRLYLTHILLFNLLILAGLVFRYLQPGAPLPPLAVPLLMCLMAALKLGWLYAFSASAGHVAGTAVPRRQSRRAAKAGLVLLSVYTAVSVPAWYWKLPTLLGGSVILLEALVLGGAALSAAFVVHKARSMPRGRQRHSALWFGLFHLVLLLAIVAALAASWIRPGPQGQAQLIANGLFLLLFNLFPPFWIRHYIPPAAETAAERFDALGVTRREREIIGLIKAGKTNQEIADCLFISVATVKDHNNNLFRKCGVRNRVELANLFR